MSKRNKRKAHNRAARGPAAQAQRPSVADSSGPAAVTAPVRPVSPQPVPAYASGVTAPRRVTQAAVANIDIDERVPHFTGDLRRIGLTAVAMFAIIIVASLLVH